MEITKPKLRNWTILTTTVDNTPDLEGYYKLSSNSLDYNNETNDDFKDYFSEKLVYVRGGCVRTVDLIQACDQLHDATGYWGCYIENLKYRPDTNTIEVEFGS